MCLFYSTYKELSFGAKFAIQNFVVLPLFDPKIGLKKWALNHKEVRFAHFNHFMVVILFKK